MIFDLQSRSIPLAGLVMVLLFASAGCEGERKPAMEWIEISKDGKGFAGAVSGKAFAPWGFNYDRDYKMRLIEDYWEAEWATVAEDFREMKALGANVVRAHFQFAKFMDGPEKPNRGALKQLGRILALAEETGLYLDITGLASFRKSDVPAWYNACTEEQRWAAQARFWEAVAERCKNSPAVFCYDLMNEPVVPTGKRKAGEWLAGELGGFSYVQFLSLDQAGRPQQEIARRWAAAMVAAIRKHDKRHLISVGMLPFAPGEMAREVDFVCVHIYPRGDKMAEDLKTVERFAAAGKPLVVEETFPMHCSAEQLKQFMAQTKEQVRGWIGFYWGQKPEELRESKKLGDALTLAWLTLFQEMRGGYKH